MNRSVRAASLTALVAVFGPGAFAAPQSTLLSGLKVLETAQSPLVASLIAQDDLSSARLLIKNGKFTEAVAMLTRMIKERNDSPLLFAERANAYFGLKNFAAADADFTKAIELKKTVPNSYFNRGIVRLQTGNWAGAITDFTEVITIGPKPKPNELDLVLESYANRAFCYSQQKKYVEAITDYDKVAAVDPKRFDIFLNRSYAYTQISPPNNDNALADLAKALALPVQPSQKRDAYFDRANIYIKLQKFNEAIADYTEFLKFDAENVDVYNTRAAAYFQVSKFNEAIADYDKVIKLKPADAETYKNRAAAKSRIKDWQGTILDYSAYLQKVPNPTDNSIFRVRGTAYLNVTPKNYAGAIGDFKAYLAKNPNDASGWKDLSAAQYNQAQPFDKSKAAMLNDAIASATKATTLDPKQADAFLIQADSLSLQEKYKDAIAPYSKYIALKPNEPYGYEGRGRVEYNTQDYKSAVVDFEKYLSLKAGDAEIKKLLALAKASAGGTSATERIAALSEAIKADPSDPVAFTNRGVAYFEMADYDKAIADFQKALELKPADPTYLLNLASALDKKAEKTGADADRTAAAAAYGKINTPEAALSRAGLFLQLKQWDSAIAEYTKAITANQSKPEILAALYNNRAYCALQKSPADFMSAIADYGKVIALNPTDPAPYKVRGLAYFDQKNYPSCITDLEKYLQLTGNKDADTTLSLASAYFNLGVSKRQQPGGGQAEFDKATASYAAFLVLKPGDAQVLYSKGLSQFRKAQAQLSAKAEKDGLATLKKAIDDFEAATKAKAELADAWYYLGLSADTYGVKDELSQEDMFKKAIAAYEKYITLPGVSATDIKTTKDRIQQLKDAL